MDIKKMIAEGLLQPFKGSLLTHNFGSHLSKMRPAGAFRFVTLFNLQGTRRLAEHLVLYKIHSSLSRTFFKFFKLFRFIFCITAAHRTAWL